MFRFHSTNRRLAPALLAFFALAGAAGAQQICRPGQPCYRPPLSSAQRGASPACPAHVVRVRNEQSGETSCGSGTLVDQDARCGWVLTCGHLFSDGVGQVAVDFPTLNQRYYAEVLKIDTTHDLALLLIRTSPARPAPIAQTRPERGAPLVFHGFGSGDYRAARGSALQNVSLDGGQTWAALQWQGAARQGDSGGPVFNVQNELVAIIAGSDGTQSVGSDCLQIRQFLQNTTPAFGQASAAPLVSVPPQTPAPPNNAPAQNVSLAAAQLKTLQAEVERLKQQLAALATKSNRPASQCDCPAPPRVEQLLEALAADARFRGPTGPRGPEGPAGQTGPAGEAGRSAALDPAAVAQEVLEKLPHHDAEELAVLTARLAALEAAFQGQIRYRLRRVPVAQLEE